ncbi:MAG: YceI family protein [Gemmatimonadales bacterium]|nr:YceI family protein [Gemmatimonadales bacterium]
MLSALFASLVALAPVPAAAPADSVMWRIDASHSEIGFKIRHFMSRVRGRFNEWSGTLVVDPARLDQGSVDITIKTASINTANERRDNDLRSQNFFLADSFPTITFKSKRVVANGTNMKIVGDLTIKGVTKEVILEGEMTGTIGPAAPRQRIGFSFTTVLNRTDYGIVWNRAVEGGGVMLGDDVTVEISIEAIRQ